MKRDHNYLNWVVYICGLYLAMQIIRGLVNQGIL